MNNYSVTVNGKVYKVSVEASYPINRSKESQTSPHFMTNPQIRSISSPTYPINQAPWVNAKKEWHLNKQ